jgi:hypothetical protein
MSYEVYKLIHFLGIILLFMALGGAALHVMNGGTKATNGSRKIVAISHGVALFLILLGGMGLMKWKGISHAGPYPVWLYPKVLIWLLMGGITALIWRKPGLGNAYWLLIPVLGAVAVFFATMKPFVVP